MVVRDCSSHAMSNPGQSSHTRLPRVSTCQADLHKPERPKASSRCCAHCKEKKNVSGTRLNKYNDTSETSVLFKAKSLIVPRETIGFQESEIKVA